MGEGLGECSLYVAQFCWFSAYAMGRPPLRVPPIPIDKSMLANPPEWNPSITGMLISLPKYAESINLLEN